MQTMVLFIYVCIISNLKRSERVYLLLFLPISLSFPLILPDYRGKNLSKQFKTFLNHVVLARYITCKAGCVLKFNDKVAISFIC